jgi:hypothetical protein
LLLPCGHGVAIERHRGLPMERRTYVDWRSRLRIDFLEGDRHVKTDITKSMQTKVGVHMDSDPTILS